MERLAVARETGGTRHLPGQRRARARPPRRHRGPLERKGRRAAGAGPARRLTLARRDDPIHFLRLFSNYLTPKTGVLSPDTWRMLAFYIRGLLFTWVVLLPLLLAAVMFGQTFFMTSSAADAFVRAPPPPRPPPRHPGTLPAPRPS